MAAKAHAAGALMQVEEVLGDAGRGGRRGRGGSSREVRVAVGTFFFFIETLFSLTGGMVGKYHQLWGQFL